MSKINSGYQLEKGRKESLVYGVGINDSPTTVETVIKDKDGNKIRWICSYYARWKNMIKRCYHVKSLYPTYDYCTVCDEWIYFSKFKAWMEQQDWEGKQLDKDILGNGRLYSPTTCVFVSQKINSLVLDSLKSRGSEPIGVYFNKKDSVYEAYCHENNKKVHLGRYKDSQSAHKAWCDYKLNIVYNLNNVEPRVKEALIKRYRTIQESAPELYQAIGEWEEDE